MTAASDTGHARAQTKFVRRGPPLGPLRAHKDASAPAGTPGYFVPIVDPPDKEALALFHERLRDLEQGVADGRKVRVAMFGASGTAADLATGYVRTYLQSRFGDAGPGFVPLVPLNRWYRHSELKVEASKGWKKEHAQTKSGRLDGHYGWLGASFATKKKNRWAKVSPKRGSTSAQAVTGYELFYLVQPGGGSFRLSVDGERRTVVETEGSAYRAGYHTVDLEAGPHTLKITTVGDGEVRVFGVAVESAGPGIVVDTLGINGTRSANHLTWNQEIWRDNASRRHPELYTLSYGTNESVDEDWTADAYRRGLRQTLENFRATLPEASCLLLIPGDFPIVTDQGPAPRPVLKEINDIQRELAPEYGCGYWDGMAFMGGMGSMARFVEAEPPLARQDYLHFNGRGAARKGMALSDALMLQYDSASAPDALTAR